MGMRGSILAKIGQGVLAEEVTFQQRPGEKKGAKRGGVFQAKETLAAEPPGLQRFGAFEDQARGQGGRVRCRKRGVSAGDELEKLANDTIWWGFRALASLDFFPACSRTLLDDVSCGFQEGIPITSQSLCF